MHRNGRRLLVGALAGMAIMAGPSASVSAEAASGRPDFQAPFKCGDVWTWSTYEGHGRYDLDLIDVDGSTTGSPIVASAPGTVSIAQHFDDAGNMVVVDHEGGWQTRYLHLDSMSVKVGQKLEMGEELGKAGNTGHSTGPHLHYEQRLDGVEQQAYFDGVAAKHTYDYFEYEVKSNNCGQTGPDESARPMRDYDGDGEADLFARKSDGTYVLFSGNGAGKFGGRAINGGWQWFDLIEGVGDVNLDGDPDVVARQSDGDLYLYRGDGEGGFGERSRVSGGWQYFDEIEGVGDMNGDGRGDIFARKSDGTYMLYEAHSKGFAGSEVNGGWQYYDEIEGVGDVDGDGRADLVARNSKGDLHLFRGSPSGAFVDREKVSGGWQYFTDLEGIGDVTGDGRPDIFARKKDGTYKLFKGGADGGFGGTDINKGWQYYDTITQ